MSDKGTRGIKLLPIENCAWETQRGCKQVCNSAGKMSSKTVKQQFQDNKKNKKTWCSQDDDGKKPHACLKTLNIQKKSSVTNRNMT